jgi:hypothetical protein
MLYNFSIGRIGQNAIDICLLRSANQWIWMRDGEDKALEAFSYLIAQQPSEVRLKKV